MLGEYVNVVGASKLLLVKTDTIYRYVKLGLITATRIRGHLMISTDSIKQLFENTKNVTPPPIKCARERFLKKQSQEDLGIENLLPTEWIVKNKQSYVVEQGIYFLIDGNEVVYVGQSLDFRTRMATHSIDKRKTFDSFFFLPVNNRENLDWLELEYIQKLKPRDNRAGIVKQEVPME